MGKPQSKDSQENLGKFTTSHLLTHSVLLDQLAGLDLDNLEISSPFEFKKGVQMVI